MVISHQLKEGQCEYCSEDLDKSNWGSEWCDGDKHYKSLECGCGKKNWLRVDFEGSGHDCVLSGEQSELESMVKKVQEG